MSAIETSHSFDDKIHPEEANQTILIVDDAKENIVILGHLLKDEAEVIFATNGRDGLAKVQSQRPDLILLDISMPGMNGFEVLGTRVKITYPNCVGLLFVFKA